MSCPLQEEAEAGQAQAERESTTQKGTGQTGIKEEIAHGLRLHCESPPCY